MPDGTEEETPATDDDEVHDPELDELLRPDPPAQDERRAGHSAPRKPDGFLPDLLGVDRDQGRQGSPAASSDGPYRNGDETTPATGNDGEKMPVGDRMPSGQLQALEEFLGHWPEDFNVDVRVSQVTSGRLLSRGMLENVLLSYARVPERYIPYGGLFFLEFFALGAKRARLGKGGHRVRLMGKDPPNDWRVEDTMDIDTTKLAQAIVTAMAAAQAQSAGHPGTPGVPTGVWKDNVDQLRQQNADMSEELRKTREALAEKRAADAVKDAVAQVVGPMQVEMASLRNAIASRPAPVQDSEHKDALMITVIKALTERQNTGTRDVDVLKIVMDNYQKTQGPDALASIAGLYNEMVDGLKKTIEGMRSGASGPAAAAAATESAWTPEKITGMLGAAGMAMGKVGEFFQNRRAQMLEAVNAAQSAATPSAAKPAAPAALTAAPDTSLKDALNKSTQKMFLQIQTKASPEAIAATLYATTVLAETSSDPKVREMMDSVKDDPLTTVTVLIASLGGDAEVSAAVGRKVALMMGKSYLTPVPQASVGPADEEPTPGPAAVAAPAAVPSLDVDGPDTLQGVVAEASGGQDVIGSDDTTTPGNGEEGGSPHAVVSKPASKKVMRALKPA